MFDDVLVPLDGSDRSAQALEPAAKIASAMNSTLLIISFASDPFDDSLRDRLEAQVAPVKKFGDFVHHITIEPISGSIATSFQTWLDDRPGAMVCMGTHGRGRSAALFGSTASDVLRYRTGPVMLVGPAYRPGRFEVDAAMLVAVDGSDHAEQILPIAESWGIVFHNLVEIAQVVAPQDQRLARDSGAAGRDIESAYVRRVCADVSEKVGTGASFEVLHDEKPAEAIVRRAIDRGIGVIAMTTHGETGTARLLSGSVMADVVRHSPCPVMTLRPRTLR